jgi:hypothetical protein
VTGIGFDDAWLSPNHQTFTAGWHDPNGVALTAVRDLEAAHLTDAYAQYWVAYDVDLLSHERLSVSDVYSDRWVALYYKVRAAPSAAWLFYAPSQVAVASVAFDSTAPGPYAYPESLFLSKLAALGVGYRLVHAGVLDAIVPDRPVTQEQVGIPPPYWH